MVCNDVIPSFVSLENALRDSKFKDYDLLTGTCANNYFLNSHDL